MARMLPPMNEVEALRTRLQNQIRTFEDDLSHLPLDGVLPLGGDDAAKIKIKEVFNTKAKLFLLAREKIQTMNYDKLNELRFLHQRFAVGKNKLETNFANGRVITHSDLDFYDLIRDFWNYKDIVPWGQRFEILWVENKAKSAAAGLIVAAVGCIIAALAYFRP